MNREILFTALLSVWFNCLFGQTNQPSPTDIGYLWNELQTVCADSAHEFLCMATANDELETVCKTAFSNALADISEGKVLYNAVFTDFVHSKSLHNQYRECCDIELECSGLICATYYDEVVNFKCYFFAMNEYITQEFGADIFEKNRLKADSLDNLLLPTDSILMCGGRSYELVPKYLYDMYRK